MCLGLRWSVDASGLAALGYAQALQTDLSRPARELGSAPQLIPECRCCCTVSQLPLPQETPELINLQQRRLAWAGRVGAQPLG